MRRGIGGGFTLLELLIVVVIAGIAASLALMRYQRMVECQYRRVAVKTLRSILAAEKPYRLENDVFTNTFTALPVDDPNARELEHPIHYDISGTTDDVFSGTAAWVGHAKTLTLTYDPDDITGDPPGEELALGTWCP